MENKIFITELYNKLADDAANFSDFYKRIEEHSDLTLYTTRKGVMIGAWYMGCKYRFKTYMNSERYDILHDLEHLKNNSGTKQKRARQNSLIFILKTNNMTLYDRLFNSKNKHGLYGSASYMTGRELRRLFHRKSHGVSLDSKKHLKSEFTCLNTLVVAPTGAGKSTMIKGNILQKTAKHPHSFWVIDPASDIHRECHKWTEKQGMINKVINLDDASKSLRFNPLTVAKNTPNGIEDLASLLIQIQYEGASGGDPYWRDAGENILVLLFRALTAEGQEELKQNLGSVYSLLNWFGAQQERLDKFIITHLRNNEKAKDEYKSLVANSGDNSKMLLSVVSTAKSALSKIVNNETLCEITSSDNFAISTLRQIPQAIWIQVAEHRLNNSGVKAILSIINSFLFAQCMELPKGGEKQLEVHAYIDEAGAFFIQGLSSYIVVMRKRKISIQLFLQDVEQLQIYGVSQAKIIASNCLNKCFFGSISNETALWASSLVGNDTQEVFERPIGIPLISAQEIRDLPKNEMLFVHKNKATILKLHPYYKQWRLKKRTQL